MKISLWTQFSSNHSSNFTVIGRFGTSQEAQKVYATLRDWMQKIVFEAKTSPSETEIEISQTYNLEWYEDGLDWNGTPNSIDNIMMQIGNDVLLTCPIETWDSPIPLVGLMWKLGARKADYEESDRLYLSIYLTCTAPDETAAESFTKTANPFLIDHNALHTPWSDDFGALCWGRARYKGTLLEMHLQFVKIEVGLNTLLNYLQQRGFTDIQYGFRQQHEWNQKYLVMLSEWFN
jgi:hypothetical protein